MGHNVGTRTPMAIVMPVPYTGYQVYEAYYSSRFIFFCSASSVCFYLFVTSKGLGVSRGKRRKLKLQLILPGTWYSTRSTKFCDGVCMYCCLYLLRCHFSPPVCDTFFNFIFFAFRFFQVAPFPKRPQSICRKWRGRETTRENAGTEPEKKNSDGFYAREEHVQRRRFG